MADQPATMDGKPLLADELVYRIVSNKRRDVDLGRVLPAPDQFCASENDHGMSVWIDRVLRDEGRTPEQLIAQERQVRPHAQLASLKVGALVANGLQLVHDGNPVPWHGNVFGLPEEESELEAVQQALGEASVWVVPSEQEQMSAEFDNQWEKAHKRVSPDRNVLKNLHNWLCRADYTGVEEHRKKVAEALDHVDTEAAKRKKQFGR